MVINTTSKTCLLVGGSLASGNIGYFVNQSVEGASHKAELEDLAKKAQRRKRRYRKKEERNWKRKSWNRFNKRKRLWEVFGKH